MTDIYSSGVKVNYPQQVQCNSIGGAKKQHLSFYPVNAGVNTQQKGEAAE